MSGWAAPKATTSLTTESYPEPYPVPASWLSGNHYLREYVRRLEAVADAARNYYDVGRPEGIAELEARATLRSALRRLDGDE